MSKKKTLVIYSMIVFLSLTSIFSFIALYNVVEIRLIQTEMLREIKRKNEIDLNIWDMHNQYNVDVDQRINFLWSYFYEKLGHDLPSQPS
ncbi:MAG: hypothetical protein RR565_04870 [Erysipelothrix sp.]